MVAMEVVGHPLSHSGFFRTQSLVSDGRHRLLLSRAGSRRVQAFKPGFPNHSHRNIHDECLPVYLGTSDGKLTVAYKTRLWSIVYVKTTDGCVVTVMLSIRLWKVG